MPYGCCALRRLGSGALRCALALVSAAAAAAAADCAAAACRCCLKPIRPTTDPQAYYRRGDANVAMGKFKLALKDLKAVR